MFKKLLVLTLLVSILYIFSLATLDIFNIRLSKITNYYIENTYKETGSKNYVTGIYLDYRLYDSIFETSTLLIAIAGIMFITKENN